MQGQSERVCQRRNPRARPIEKSTRKEAGFTIFERCDTARDLYHLRDEMRPRSRGENGANLFAVRGCIGRSATPAPCSLPVEDAGRSVALIRLLRYLVQATD